MTSTKNEAPATLLRFTFHRSGARSRVPAAGVLRSDRTAHVHHRQRPLPRVRLHPREEDVHGRLRPQNQLHGVDLRGELHGLEQFDGERVRVELRLGGRAKDGDRNAELRREIGQVRFRVRGVRVRGGSGRVHKGRAVRGLQGKGGGQQVLPARAGEEKVRGRYEGGRQQGYQQAGEENR